MFSIAMHVSAKVQLVDVINESSLDFGLTFCDGTPILGAMLDQPSSCMTEAAGDLQIVFEDAGPACLGSLQKLYIWLENDLGFPLLPEDQILYAVIFYEGDAEISLHLDYLGKLRVLKGANVQNVLYPWMGN